MKKLFITVALILSSVVSVGSSTNKNDVWTFQSYNTMMADREKQHECLAKNIYFEARNEPFVGQFAVALVTLNRVHDSAFPNTICEVVYEGIHTASGFPKKHRCQFSWWCDGQKDIIWATYMSGEVIPENMTAWRDSIHVALFIMNGDYKMDPTDGAVFYYNPHIANPSWGAVYSETAMIGNHRFMKDK